MLLKEGVSSVYLCGVWIIWRYILNFRTDASVECWKHYSYFSGYCHCYYHYYHHRCAVSLRIQVCYAFVLVIFSPNLQDLLGERPVCGNSFFFKNTFGEVLYIHCFGNLILHIFIKFLWHVSWQSSWFPSDCKLIKYEMLSCKNYCLKL